MVGSKIREYRTKAGLTQKELANELHVTYQAVSRWENDDAEPSFDTLKAMCGILNCSMDDLFGIEKKPAELPNEQPPQVVQVVATEAQPILCVCEHCNKPITDADDICRVDEEYKVRKGKGNKTEIRRVVLCKECNQKRLDEEQRKEETQKKVEADNRKKRRVHSFVWPSLVAIVLFAIAAVFFVKGNTVVGALLCAAAVGLYFFLATMILNNTFVSDMWMEISSWGFVKVPGVIFSLSLDGIVALIAIKIVLFILGVALAFVSVAFATSVAAILSIFVYPVALKKNISGD